VKWNGKKVKVIYDDYEWISIKGKNVMEKEENLQIVDLSRRRKQQQRSHPEFFYY